MRLTRKQVFISLAIILIFASLLRLWGLADAGCRFSDEGYHLLAVKEILAHQPESLYFKHGLHWWNTIGTALFGVTAAGSLYWAALTGILSTLLFYPIARYFLGRTVISLATTGLFSCCYYLLFYHRSNMSDGHALFFFLAILALTIYSLRGLLRSKQWDLGFTRMRLAALAMTGLLLGICFTVRIQTCLTNIGFIGAVCLLFCLMMAKRRPQPLLNYVTKLTAMVCVIASFAVLGYAIVMLGSGDLVNWESTIAWYMKNYTIAEGSQKTWHPYILYHLLKLCGWPLLAIGLVGFIHDLVRPHRLPWPRKWLLLCTVVLSLMFLLTAMPWPRGHLYAVILLLLYWGVGIRALMLFLKRKHFPSQQRALLIATVFLLSLAWETVLSINFIGKHANLTKATDYMRSKITKANDDKTNFLGTHAWPVFRAEMPDATSYIIYAKEYSNYRELCVALVRGYHEKGVRFLQLDHNLSNFGGDHVPLQQLLLTVKPDKVYYNDLGSDYHTCMDAFGKPPDRDIFSDYIVIYDLAKLKQLPLRPKPYTTDSDMLAQFQVLQQK